MSNELAKQEPSLTLVLQAIAQDPKLASSTKHKYRRAVVRYVEDGNRLTDADALAAYAETASASERSFQSAAVTRLTDAMERQAKGQATPDNVAAVQATVYRAEALRGAIPADQPKGSKAHTWLSMREVKELLDCCGDGIVGHRDRLALGLLVAAGLRRQEAVDLRFDDVKLQPSAGKMRTVLDIRGKGKKDRAVPTSDSLANAIDEWAAVVGSEGRVLRSLGRNREPTDSMTATALYYLVRRRGAEIGKSDLPPHDLRRTYAQLGKDAGISITQISKLLGHASVETTMRYLNVELDLETTMSDFVPF